MTVNSINPGLRPWLYLRNARPLIYWLKLPPCVDQSLFAEATAGRMAAKLNCCLCDAVRARVRFPPDIHAPALCMIRDWEVRIGG